MNHSYRVILFDFDGTLVDTGEGIINSLKYALEKNGVEIPDMEKLRKFIGPPIYDSFVNDYGVEPEKVKDFIFRYRERYTKIGIYESHCYDGVEHLLQELKNKGYLIGIASSKPEQMVYTVADYLKILDKIDVICGASLDETKKITKKDLITLCCQKLGIKDKNEVLMVGDRIYDIKGANDAQIDSAGLLHGYGTEKEFKTATYIFKNAEELKEFLLSE